MRLGARRLRTNRRTASSSEGREGKTPPSEPKNGELLSKQQTADQREIKEAEAGNEDNCPGSQFSDNKEDVDNAGEEAGDEDEVEEYGLIKETKGPPSNTPETRSIRAQEGAGGTRRLRSS